MNAANPYLKQYKKNQIETATPEQLLILLYDGAIQYLNRAKIAIEENNDTEFHGSIFGCQKIIIEFMNTLDMDIGGKLAKSLYDLYDYYYRTLVNAGFSKNVKEIDEVLHHLTGLRETWMKAIEISNAEKKVELHDKDEDEDEDSEDMHEALA